MCLVYGFIKMLKLEIPRHSSGCLVAAGLASVNFRGRRLVQDREPMMWQDKLALLHPTTPPIPPLPLLSPIQPLSH